MPETYSTPGTDTSKCPKRKTADRAEKTELSRLNAKGYGRLFKLPMLDQQLTIEAKGIYCYICSYAGADATAFPGREKIMSDLHMCKDAYYRHYQLLLDNDYLRVEQKNLGGNSHGYLNNLYRVVETPQKFRAGAGGKHYAETCARIQRGSLLDGGYGFIPRSVMVDSSLSVKAKALYGYYRSFAGAGSIACPEKKDLLYHLGISAKLHGKLLDELTTHGLIALSQRHIGGRLGVTEVLLLAEPAAVAETKTKTKTRRVKVIPKEETNSFAIQKQDTQIRDMQTQDAQKQDTQTQDSNTTKPNKTNVYQNQSDHQQCALREEDGWEDKEQRALNVFKTLLEHGIMPKEWIGKRDRIEAALCILLGYDGELREPGRQLFVRALTDMLCTRKGMVLTGESVGAVQVYQMLLQYISCSESTGLPQLELIDDLVLDTYEEACQARSIKNPLGYLKSCIWTVLKTGDAALRARIAREVG